MNPAVVGKRPVGEEHPISCPYGVKGPWKKGYHRGVDFACPVGTPISAYRKGKIVWAADAGDEFGLYVKIDHGFDVTYYCHLSQVFVGVNDRIDEGYAFAASGNSGNVRFEGKNITEDQRREGKGAHLHFEARIAGKDVEPLFYT